MTSDEFVSWFAETSIAVSVLIFLILLVRKEVATRFGPEASYLLWLAPLARLVTPQLSILPASWRETPAPMVAEWAYAAAATDAVMPLSSQPLNFSAAIFAVWVVGAVIFMGAQFIAQINFMRRMERESVEPTTEIAAEAATLAAKAGMHGRVRIRVARDNVGPLVAGVMRPVIVVPADFERNYSSVERQLAFAHEFAHIRRGDLATNLAALIFRAVQWPNPLAHYAFRAFRADQEAACDAAVVARNETWPDISYAYGAALVKSASQRFAAPAASLAMSNHLKERLMLLKSRKKSSAAIGRIMAASLIAIGVAASASYSYAAEKEKKVSSINVIEADNGETLEIDGAKNAMKIEVKTEDGERTVKIWDKDGKLISERKSKADEAGKAVKIISRDGKEKTIVVGAAPEHQKWMMEVAGGEMDMEMLEGEHDGHAMHKMIFVNGDSEHHMIKGDCAASGDAHAFAYSTSDDADSDSKRIARKEIICIDDDDNADPAKRAEALRKVIGHMEENAKREAAHRDAMIAKMKEELAKAEKEAKKK